MRLSTFSEPSSFLDATRLALESQEAANSLMLGICGRLAQHPDPGASPPHLSTVVDGSGLVMAALMTPPHKLVVYGHRGDLDVASELLVRELIDGGWHLPGVFGPSDIAGRIATAWTHVTGRPATLAGRQTVYQLDEVLVPIPPRGRLRRAIEGDVPLVADWHYAFHHEIFGKADEQASVRAAASRVSDGDIYLWVDGEPLSMAMTTRATRRGISVSLVYTPREQRSRGYATACVGELSRTLLREGWQFCSLFADQSNVPASRVYLRIGYQPVCDYDEYDCAEEPALDGPPVVSRRD